MALGGGTAKAPARNRLSELNDMAFGLVVYASWGKSPDPTQDSLPGAGQALLGGLSTRKVPMKGFQHVFLTSFPPFPSLLGASLFSVHGLPLRRTHVWRPT